jgi:phenylpropionate dioxygenase-like ring-hydroxylating dioxygenase large terminal subunit
MSDEPEVRVDAHALSRGHVVVIVIDREEFVIWRGHDGRVRSAPRTCPHLDHDLGEGRVDGNELVCPGHAWSFDGNGHAFKRNEFGRADPKGEVAVLTIEQAGDEIRLSRKR